MATRPQNYKTIVLAALFFLSSWDGGKAAAGAEDTHPHDHKAASSQTVKGKEPREAIPHDIKAPAETALFPAEGASVKILAPKDGQTVKGDQVPLQFKLVKGKKGEHVHAYVDGELMGMFSSEKGSLNGIKPGPHTLELRVVTADHKAELNATDRIRFTVK
ncbi:MAG: hypothetical protein ACREQW_09085 [Candidatus Binatia bacterium]